MTRQHGGPETKAPSTALCPHFSTPLSVTEAHPGLIPQSSLQRMDSSPQEHSRSASSASPARRLFLDSDPRRQTSPHVSRMTPLLYISPMATRSASYDVSDLRRSMSEKPGTSRFPGHRHPPGTPVTESDSMPSAHTGECPPVHTPPTEDEKAFREYLGAQVEPAPGSSQDQAAVVNGERVEMDEESDAGEAEFRRYVTEKATGHEAFVHHPTETEREAAAQEEKALRKFLDNDKENKTSESGESKCCFKDMKDMVAPVLTGAAVLAGVALAYKGCQMCHTMWHDSKDAPLTEVTLAMIKPDAVKAGRVEEIKADITAHGFKIVSCKEVTFTDDMVDAFYAEHVGKSFYPTLKAFITSGPAVALALQRVGAIKAWRALMGPTNTAVAIKQAPKSLRARYGFDGTKNATHGSDSPASALRELSFHFPSCETTIVLVSTSLEKPASGVKAQIEAAGFSVVRECSSDKLSSAQVQAFTADASVPASVKAALNAGPETPVLILALRKQNAITACSKTGSAQSLGLPILYASASYDSAARDLYALFPPVETTLAMIKPDAVKNGSACAIKKKIRAAGLRIVACKKVHLTAEQVDEFYAEHKGRSFFPSLAAFMTSGPVYALALRGPGAVLAWRKLMGPTSTEKAKAEEPESLRALFGTDNTKNATHGSDSHEAAARELAFHFPEKAAQQFWGFQWF